MSTARRLISSALTFRLNRLSPGETLDADLAATCLVALNDVADTLNGQGSFLFREILSPGVCNGVSGTLGVTWAGIRSGDQILGATVSYGVGMDIPMSPMTMEQYASISNKATASVPRLYAPDGAGTGFLWPAATGQTVTLRTKQVVSDFADLDTDYTMPDGYPSGLSALLAELLAPTLLGGIPPAIEKAARAARMRLGAQASNPAIIDTTRRTSGNILSGWN